MFHIIKYTLLALFIAALSIFFISNADVAFSLRFKFPPFIDSGLPPVYLNYLLLISFCIGIVFAAFLGALRFRAVRRKKKEMKEEVQHTDPATHVT